jgi:hypothetical protein
MKKNIALGIDIGGVIIQSSDDSHGDTSFFSGNYLNTPAMDGVFGAVAALVARRFGPKTWLVSKCGTEVEAKSRAWLAEHDFFARTRIPPENLRFCLERRDKAGICAELGITHFIDDRLEVLSYLETVLNRYLFKPRESEVRKFESALPLVHRVESWKEARDRILAR